MKPTKPCPPAETKRRLEAQAEARKVAAKAANKATKASAKK